MVPSWIHKCIDDPLNMHRPRMCYHAEFGRSTSKGVNMNTGWTKNGEERCGSAPWDERCGRPRKYARPHMRYTVERGRSVAIKGVGMNGGQCPKLGSARAPPPCDRRLGWTPRNTPLLRMCYPAELCRSRSNGANVMKEIPPEEFDPSGTSHLLRSLNVIGTDTDWSAAYDFLLTFHRNHGPVSYRFTDKRRFQSNIVNFSNPWCI